jgi:hypothetical protein
MTERINTFIGATLEYGSAKISRDIFSEILTCLKTKDLSNLEKLRLFVTMLQYMLKEGHATSFDEAVKPEENKKVFLQYAMLFSIALLASAHDHW